MDGNKETRDSVAYLNMISSDMQGTGGESSHSRYSSGGFMQGIAIRKVVISLIVIFIVIIAVFLIVVVVNTINTTNKKEAYGYVSEVEKTYMKTLSYYRTYVGLGVNTNEHAITPFSKEELEKIDTSLVGSRLALEAYRANVKSNISSINKDQKASLDRSIEFIENNLNRIDYNVNLLSKYYVAFSEPVHDAIRSNNRSDCTPNATARELLNNSDESIKVSAQEYSALICEVIHAGAESIFVTNNYGAKALSAQRSMFSNTKEIKDSSEGINNLAEIRHALEE